MTQVVTDNAVLMWRGERGGDPQHLLLGARDVLEPLAEIALGEGGDLRALPGVEEILYDCDVGHDPLSGPPAGPACHTGERTCFYRSAYRRGGRNE